jgi:hypothetical protein
MANELIIKNGVNVSGGITANTISATTYYNLPVSGSTFNGGTVSGSTNFTNGLTANTETIIGRIPTSATGSVSTGSAPYGLYVQGRYVYVVNESSQTLQIFDVSNPSSPVSGGTVSTGSSPRSLYVQGRYVYVVNETSQTLQIFDVSNPSSPVSVGSVSTGGFSSPSSVYVQGRYAYVTCTGSNTLQIFDVSNPSSPISVGSVTTGTSPYSVYVQGRYAYVTYLNAILRIFDVSNPSSPVSVGSVATGTNPYGLYVQGRYVYVVNHGSNTLQIFDVSNPSSLVLVGSVTTGTSPRSVYVQGMYAYVVNNFSSTLQIFDVSNPSSPVSVGSASTATGPHGVFVQGRYAYVINVNSNNLQIFDVSGSYIQQLEAGGILTNTLESVGNATIGNDLTVVGGLNVSQSTNIQGNLSATNIRVVSGITSTTSSGVTTTYSGTKGSAVLDGSTSTSFLTFSGSNTIGGTGYTDFIRVTNTAAGATSPSKTFRTDIFGSLEIINNAYNSTLFSLTDSGNLTVPGRVKSTINYSQTGGTASVTLGASASQQTILSVSLTTYGNPVMICAYGDAENTGAGYWCALQLWRDSTQIGAIVHAEGSAASENIPFAMTYYDAPAAGTYTYYLKANQVTGGNFKFGESTAPILNAREL